MTCFLHISMYTINKVRFNQGRTIFFQNGGKSCKLGKENMEKTVFLKAV